MKRASSRRGSSAVLTLYLLVLLRGPYSNASMRSQRQLAASSPEMSSTNSLGTDSIDPVESSGDTSSNITSSLGKIVGAGAPPAQLGTYGMWLLNTILYTGFIYRFLRPTTEERIRTTREAYYFRRHMLSNSLNTFPNALVLYKIVSVDFCQAEWLIALIMACFIGICFTSFCLGALSKMAQNSLRKTLNKVATVAVHVPCHVAAGLQQKWILLFMLVIFIDVKQVYQTFIHHMHLKVSNRSRKPLHLTPYLMLAIFEMGYCIFLFVSLFDTVHHFAGQLWLQALFVLGLLYVVRFFIWSRSLLGVVLHHTNSSFKELVMHPDDSSDCPTCSNTMRLLSFLAYSAHLWGGEKDDEPSFEMQELSADEPVSEQDG